MKDRMIEELPVSGVIETDDGREPRRYEIGCLLVPIIGAETVATVAETLIREAIVVAGGQVISGENPKLIPLAYSIRKTVENKNLRFKEAYFISLRFIIAPEKIIELDKTLRFSPSVLRFFIIKLPTLIEELRRRPKEGASSPVERPTGSVKDGESMGVEISQADMDREIESLLAPAL